MSRETVVELSKNGTEARVIFAKDLIVRDLWHIAMGIKNGACKRWSQKERDEICEEILDVWYRAHDMKEHIIDRE